MNADLDLPTQAIRLNGTQDERLKRVGRRLRTARERRGMSVSEFAQQAHIDRAALEAIERGDPSSGVASLVRILTTLGIVDKFELLVGDGADAANPQSLPTMAKPGSPDPGSQAATCRKFREGFCQEVFVYRAFRPLFGD
jgi:transcriptional regulator with XRE-family HTH domain